MAAVRPQLVDMESTLNDISGMEYGADTGMRSKRQQAAGSSSKQTEKASAEVSEDVGISV